MPICQPASLLGIFEFQKSLITIGFQPDYLVYFNHLVDVDISHCRGIRAEEFIDCIAACNKIEVLKLQGCSQFSQNQLVKIMTNLKKLEYVEA